MIRKIKKSNKAVSEILGTILLLGIAVSLFSVLSYIVISYPFEPNPPNIDLLGYVYGNEIIIEHRGGEPIKLDANIIVRINDTEVLTSTAELYLNESSSNQDNYWNLGEYVLINATKDPIFNDIRSSKVDVSVVDVTSNSLVLGGILQEVD